MNKMKNILLGSILVLFVALLVYGLVTLDFENNISKADIQIEDKSTELIALLSTPVTKPPSPPSTPVPKAEVDLNDEFCFKCHDKTQVSSFHFPERIKAIDEKKGKPISICTTCHGEPVMFVHFSLIQKKIVKCETCHIIDGGGFSVPIKREEDLLVCELCHAGGDYIKIHIDGEILEGAEIDEQWIKKKDGNECIICHGKPLYGSKNILEIHEENAARAGDVSRVRESFVSGAIVKDDAEIMQIEEEDTPEEVFLEKGRENDTILAEIIVVPPVEKLTTANVTVEVINEKVNKTGSEGDLEKERDEIENETVTEVLPDWSTPREPTTVVTLN
jgi:hypothetical protein